MDAWQEKLKSEFDALAVTAAVAVPETKIVDIGLRGRVCIDGKERISHVLIQPTPCPRCGTGESGLHRSESTCIVELKSLVKFLSGGVQVIRR